MIKVKILEFMTDIILASVLVSIFFFSFILTLRLSPIINNEPDSVLGINSYELVIQKDANTNYSILSSSNSEISFDLQIKMIENNMINDYDFLLIRNKEQKEKRYAIYFDIDKDDFLDTQLLLRSGDDLLPIFEARTEDLVVKDQLIIIEPETISEFSLRTVSLNERQPKELQVNIQIKAIN